MLKNIQQIPSIVREVVHANSSLHLQHPQLLVQLQVNLVCHLKHPNIVGFVGCVATKNQHVAIAMEYVSGGSLQHLVSIFKVVHVGCVCCEQL